MGIGVCPLAADWGNWADWASVVVAGAGALAVLLLTRAANATARASHELARQLKDSDEALRVREAAVLAALLFPEVANAYAHFYKLSERLAEDDALQWVVETEENLAQFHRWAGGPDLAKLTREDGRLHVFPMKLGHAIAMGLGRAYTAADSAGAIAKARDRQEQELMFKNALLNIQGAAACFLQAKELLTETMKGKVS